jgi:zinc transporter ZupT
MAKSARRRPGAARDATASFPTDRRIFSGRKPEVSATAFRCDTRRWPAAARVRISALVFIVLFVHSLPEGLAIGTAFAAGAMLSLIAIELLQRAYARHARLGPTAGIAAGVAL